MWLAGGQRWERTTSIRNRFVGQRVKILSDSGPIPGVIATATGHAANLVIPEPTEIDWNHFWVDTGYTKAELEKKGVTPGTRIVWESRTEMFGANVVGKALDDRAALAVLTMLIRTVKERDLNYDLTLACTVQEEIDSVGAAAIGRLEQFDGAIVLEIGMTGDIPGIDERSVPLRLGKGPILVHKDHFVHYDYKLTSALSAAAKAADIDIQQAVFGMFGSDGSEFMKADIPTALVAFPARYVHTPFETAHMGDIEGLERWLRAFVTTAPTR